MEHNNNLTTRWSSAAASHKGNVRRLNEDSLSALPDIGLWTVADGMGGHTAGDVASQMIVKGLETLNRPSLFQEFVNQVEEALLQANREIFQYSQDKHQGKTLGSTVVSLLLDRDIGICLWAGDSRLYRYRSNTLLQLSHDHSAVEEMVRQGKLTREEAHKHPRSNVITRAVGANLSLHIEPYLFEIRSNDIFLLCSDGLYNELSDQEIIQILSRPDSLECKVEALIEDTLFTDARDNVSVILVKINTD